LFHTRIIATDVSIYALKIAQINIRRHQVGNNIHLVQTNLLSSIQARFDIICANLPYIPTKKLSELAVLNYEPRLALDGGKDGLVFIRQLIQESHEKLNTKGVIILEIEHTQVLGILKICKQFFPSASCTIINDLAKLPRIAVIRTDG